MQVRIRAQTTLEVDLCPSDGTEDVTPLKGVDRKVVWVQIPSWVQSHSSPVVPTTESTSMKAYGQERIAEANRHLPGTSRPCPCCIPRSAWRKRSTKVLKKRARRQWKINI